MSEGQYPLCLNISRGVSILSPMRDAALLAWTLVRGIGPRRFAHFVHTMGLEEMARVFTHPRSVRALLDLPGVELDEAPSRYVREAEALLQRARSLGIRWVFYGEPNYPPLLQGLATAPPVLFYRGNLEVLTRPLVGVVGTRRPTDYGRTQARRFGRALAEAGVGVVSGGARGIDRAVHEAVLEVDGGTVAVLGTGVDVVYPREHRRLFESIVTRDGLLLSEFLPGTGPQKEHFPRRNRLISALSLGVLIVEAPEGSGALNTATWAAEQGKEVFVLPGPVHYPSFRGNHHLLREGARLVTSPEELLADLHLAPGKARPIPALEPGEMKILSAWPVGEVWQLEDLCEHLGISPAELLPVLLNLELKGRVRQLPGKRFVREV